jgi:hypothetical protein
MSPLRVSPFLKKWKLRTLPKPNRGEVWQTDMGIAGKVRPCLLLTEYPVDDELA